MLLQRGHQTQENSATSVHTSFSSSSSLLTFATAPSTASVSALNPSSRPTCLLTVQLNSPRFTLLLLLLLRHTHAFVTPLVLVSFIVDRHSHSTPLCLPFQLTISKSTSVRVYKCVCYVSQTLNFLFSSFFLITFTLSYLLSLSCFIRLSFLLLKHSSTACRVIRI